MALPIPNKNESKKDYVERGMSDVEVVEAIPGDSDRELALGIHFEEHGQEGKLEQKKFSFEFKEAQDGDEDKGIVRAAFAKTGVVDRGGDVILPGAFDDQEIVVSSFNHGSSRGDSLPVGKGRITEKGDEAVAELQFFMSTERGREHFQVIKELGSLQQYSFGFMVTKAGELTEDMIKAGADRAIAKVNVFEVSPVLVGEGIDTRTLAVKSKKEEEPELSEEAAAEFERFTELSTKYLR